MKKYAILLLALITSSSYAKSSDIKIHANIKGGCEIQVQDADYGIVKREELVSFRAYAGTFKLLTNSLKLQCSEGVAASITQSGGVSYDGNSNYVKAIGAGAQKIPYAVYTDFMVPSKYTITTNPGNITPTKPMSIKATTKDKFSLDFTFALFFANNNFMTYSADEYKDTISYSVSF